MERLTADVCIIGAGPAGLVVAHRLLAAQISCIVLERASFEALCGRAKAGMLEHRSVQALDRCGLAGPIIERGTQNGVVEIRAGGVGHVFEYAALTGGRGHFVYPQHLLVRAWAELLIERGGALRFSTEATALDAGDGAGSMVHAASAAGPLAVGCRTVVLASGAGSRLMPPGIQTHEHTHPFRWLTVMMEMPPLGERTIYAPHDRGFAAHLRRAPGLTRYYLQIPGDEGLDAWSDERIRRELELRLSVGGRAETLGSEALGAQDGHPHDAAFRGARASGLIGKSLISGNIVERDILDLRVRVREPMQSGCVYLAGDAAHLITPAGGKGMNLAIQDALELSEGLIGLFAQGDAGRLARYSETRLPAIWRAEEFSNWMLTLQCGGVLNFHRGVPSPDATFARGLHRAQIARLFSDPAFARWFAHQYAGVDE